MNKYLEKTEFFTGDEVSVVDKVVFDEISKIKVAKLDIMHTRIPKLMAWFDKLSTTESIVRDLNCDV